MDAPAIDGLLRFVRTVKDPWAADPALSRTARALIGDAGDGRWLSIASPREVAIKVGTGKLSLGRPVRDHFVKVLPLAQTRPLPATLSHFAAVSTFPRHHGDPFDRP